MAVPLRHELKFFISPLQYQVLSRTLKATLNPDPNGDENNQYHIRSLYFDTAYDSALYDKINGTANRDKYRIRIYNFSDQMIRLECKSKFRDLISKRSVRITRDLAEQLISADPTGLESTASGLVSDTFREMRTNLLHPVVIVDYLREAYLHPAEEVRITFDMQLRSGLNSVDMFNPYLPTVPPFDHDEIILEVKYNQVLPPYIASLLTYALRDGACRSAISKYVYCRRFEFKDF
ncbi:MAG: polyphosphate polymerase domain-containing protein [Clostridiales bacterium]|nr:polyphosphate polymerase domain-containing protein [Eubacteriales bacterium]MCI5765953.1 polyphosphate polymerase domain-containing protein [Clostridiales bacterium]MDD7121754.1 polyphosphate polymerase domain-containing protein [Clostridiales bacterium]MDY5467553.1 polyphosphate polymerase domain-containing protein [Eubacteriales bacterium]